MSAESVKWVPVESSVFKSAAYLPGERQLYLRFHTDEIYCYYDFPQEDYDAFLASDSKGQYFAYNIRNQFEYQQLARS